MRHKLRLGWGELIVEYVSKHCPNSPIVRVRLCFNIPLHSIVCLAQFIVFVYHLGFYISFITHYTYRYTFNEGVIVK